MTRYEHTERHGSPHMGYSEGELLRLMGQDGWELVAAVPPQSQSNGPSLYFKRPAPALVFVDCSNPRPSWWARLWGMK